MNIWAYVSDPTQDPIQDPIQDPVSPTPIGYWVKSLCVVAILLVILHRGGSGIDQHRS